MARNVGLGVVSVVLLLWAGAGAVFSSVGASDVAMSEYTLPKPNLPLLQEQATRAPDQIAPGRELSPDSLSSGEPYLLNFWASWCVTCQAESRFLRIISDHVPIVGVALKDAPEPAARWLKEFGSPYQFSYLDAEGDYAEQLGVQGAPETFLIDGDGKVRFHYQGLLQETVWRERVLPILTGLRQE